MSKPRAAAADVELLAPDVAAEQITSFFQSLGDDTSVAVSIYAIDPKNRLRRSFLFQLPSVGSLTGADLMAQVLDKFGPGDYLAEGRDAGGKIVSSPRFTVGPLKPARVEIPDPRPATPAPASSTPPELVALLERNTRAIEALVSRPQPSMLDMLKELAAVREFLAPPAAPAAPPFDVTQVIGLVKDVLSLRDTLGDAAGINPDGPLAVLAKSLAPALTKIAERAVDSPALPAPNAPPSTDAQPSSTATEEQPVNANGLMLKVYVTQLLQYAAAGLDPRAAADRVIRTLQGFPAPMVQAALDWLDDEAAVDNLVAIDPAAAAYRPWLEQVVDLVLEAALGPDDPEAPPATAAANGATAAN